MSNPVPGNTFRLPDSFYPIKYNLSFDVSEVPRKVAVSIQQREKKAKNKATSVDFPSCCEIFIKQKTNSSGEQILSDMLELHALSLKIDRIEIREIEGTPIVTSECDELEPVDIPLSIDGATPLAGFVNSTIHNSAGLLSSSSGGTISQGASLTNVPKAYSPMSYLTDSSMVFLRNVNAPISTSEIIDDDSFSEDDTYKVCLASCCFTEAIKGTTYVKSDRNRNFSSGIDPNNNESFISASFTPCPVHETIHIRCVDGLPFPPQFSIKIYYRAQVSLDYTNDRIGTFLCHIEEDDGFISTLLEPTLARTLFPCFDEPCIKAPVQVAVTTCGGRYTVLSCSRKATTVHHKRNMATEGTSVSHQSNLTTSSRPGADTSQADQNEIRPEIGVASSHVPTEQCDKITTLFQVSAPISTYLVSFCVGKFHVLETQTNGGMCVRVFFPKGPANENDEVAGSLESNNSFYNDDTTNHSSRGWFALDLLKKAVEFYEIFFDFRLPVKKLDMVGIPNFRVLGMENWGLINMSLDYMLVDERTSVKRRQRIARLIGHEVGHQWFGNLVTIEWWNYVWLKEGFCRYLEFYFISATFPEWQIWNEFLSQITDVALQKDSIPYETHPVQCDDGLTSDPRKIFELFDTISYGKGASILKMTASILSDKGLCIAMRNLVRKHVYGNFNNADFMECAQKQYAHQPPLESAVTGINNNNNSTYSGEGVPQQNTISNTRNVQVDTLITSWVCTASHPLIFVSSSKEASDTTQESCNLTRITSVHQYRMRDLRIGIIPALIKEKIIPVTIRQHRDPTVSIANRGSLREHISPFRFFRGVHKRIDSTNLNETCPSDLDPILKMAKDSSTTPAIGQNDETFNRNTTAANCGELKNVCEIFQPHCEKGDDIICSKIHYRPSNFFESSSFSVPVRLMHIKEGQTAYSRMILLDQPFVQIENTNTSIVGKTPVFLCNSGSAGVYRVDYDTRLWQDIFSVAAFLPSIDRLCITVNLFRFRTLHLGVTSDDDLFDRCTLLPQWLWEFSSGHPAQMQATIWAYIAENLLSYVTQLRDEPVCAEELSEFIMVLFFPLYKQGMLGFFPTENKREFQANKMITTDTCNNIMEILALSKSSLFHAESKSIFEWAMRSLLVIPDEDGSVSEHCDATSGLSSLLPSTPTSQCADLISNRGRFDINNETHTDAARLAFTFLAEGGYQREWRVMLEATLALLPDVYWKSSLDAITDIKERDDDVNLEEQCKECEEDTKKSDACAGNNPSPLGENFAGFPTNFTVSLQLSVTDSVSADDIASKWVRTLVPGVAAFDDYMISTPLALFCLQLKRITNRMAISFISNTNMFEELLAISGSKLSFSFAIRFLQLGAKFCGSERVADKLRTLAQGLSANSNLSSVGAKAVSEFLEEIECNVFWTKYAAPHYACYLNSIRKDMSKITDDLYKGTGFVSHSSQGVSCIGGGSGVEHGRRRRVDESISSLGYGSLDCFRPRSAPYTEEISQHGHERSTYLDEDNDDNESNRSGVSI